MVRAGSFYNADSPSNLLLGSLGMSSKKDEPYVGLTLQVHQVSQSHKICNKNTDKFCMFLSKTHCTYEGRCLKFPSPSKAVWHRPIIPAFGRLLQEDTKFQASLGYTVRHCCNPPPPKKKTPRDSITWWHHSYLSVRRFHDVYTLNDKITQSCTSQTHPPC